MKLLIIGAKGFLGGYLTRSLDTRFEVLAPDRTLCDITDPASIRSVFAATRPEVVVLTAAIADIDRCEREPDLARAVNVAGAENVARECARTDVRLLFTSSGAIFDGDALEYRESDPPSPLSVYGKTKAEAEQAIQATLPSAAIARLSLVLGHSPHRGTNALLDKIESDFRKHTPVFAPAGEARNAIDAGTVTRWLLDLAHAYDASGIFHLGSSDAMSRYDLVCHLAQAMGYAQDLVIPHGSVKHRAPRGRRHMLIPERIRQFSTFPIPTCIQAIERCVHAHV